MTRDQRRNYRVLCSIWCGVDCAAINLSALTVKPMSRYLSLVESLIGPLPLVGWVIGTGLAAALIGGLAGWVLSRHFLKTRWAFFALTVLPTPLVGLCLVMNNSEGEPPYRQLFLLAICGLGLPFFMRAKGVI